MQAKKHKNWKARQRQAKLAERRRNYQAPSLPKQQTTEVLMPLHFLLTLFFVFITLVVGNAIRLNNPSPSSEPVVAVVNFDKVFPTQTPVPKQERGGPPTFRALNNTNPYLTDPTETVLQEHMPLPEIQPSRTIHERSLSNSPWNYNHSTDVGNNASATKTTAAASGTSHEEMDIRLPNQVVNRPSDEDERLEPVAAIPDDAPMATLSPEPSTKSKGHTNPSPAPSAKDTIANQLPLSIKDVDTGEIKIRETGDLPLLDVTRGLLDM